MGTKRQRPGPWGDDHWTVTAARQGKEASMPPWKEGFRIYPHPSRNTKALLKALRWEPPAPSPTPWESELAVDPCCSGTYSGRRPPGPQHSPHHGCRHCHHRGRVGGKAPKGLGWGPHGPGDAREQGPTPVASRSVGSHCQRARSSTGMQKGGGGPPASSILRAGTPRTVETSGAPAHSLLRVVAWAGWV